MKSRRLLAALAVASSAASGAGVLISSAPAAAATVFVGPIDGHGVGGALGVDTNFAGGYEAVVSWANGGVASASGLSLGATNRIEIYPGGNQYDAWTSSVGGAHIQDSTGRASFGSVDLPHASNGGFRINGAVTSIGSLADGRLQVDAFQIPTVYPEQNLPQPRMNEVGVQIGTFAHTTSRGALWTAGIGWPGRYMLFITDTLTGRSLHGLVDISAGSIPTLDLEASCFGLPTCVYTAGGPGVTPGGFHPLSPTRIIDTRTGLGIANGPLRSLDGRHSSLDPLTRLDELFNHEVKVTGRFGVPETGVQAVLLNVTAVGAPGPGFISVLPTPPRVGDVFNDQSSFGAAPETSNLNVAGGDIVPNLVVARVGAGGKIRFYNSFGPTHVIADIAGWIGTGGDRFAAINPTRLLDTRNGIGGPARAFGAWETRTLRVAGVAGVPTSATSVVVNITSVAATASGYTTAYPAGQEVPNASNLNYPGGTIRANLAVVKVGASGQISLLAAEAGTHLIVDVLGSYGSSGGAITAVAPVRLVDTRTGVGTPQRPFIGVESRNVQITGVGGVPANATAVILNVTSVDATGEGYLTVFPAGATRPVASNLNFNAGQNVPNLVMAKLGAGGQVSIFNETAATQVLVDLMGYVS
jgi:hypothetical protein